MKPSDPESRETSISSKSAEAGHDFLLPAARRKAWAVVCLGYMLPWAFLLLILATFAFLGVLCLHRSRTIPAWFIVKVGGLLSVTSVLLLRGLWRPRDKPEGWSLQAQACAKLFTHVGHIAKKVGVTPPENIRVDWSCGASVHQTPALGLFGRPKKTMTLGYYLLACLPEDEVTSIIAHELAHLRYQDSRLGLHASRVHAACIDRMKRLEGAKGLTAAFIRGCTRAFFDLFMRHTSAAQRLQEFRADIVSARIVSSEVAATALVRVNVLNHLLHFYAWPAVWASSLRERQLPEDICDRLVASVEAAWQSNRTAAVINDFFGEVSQPFDSHPNTIERLRVIGAAGHVTDYSEIGWPVTVAGATLLDRSTMEDLKLRLQEYYQREKSSEWSERWESVDREFRWVGRTAIDCAIGGEPNGDGGQDCEPSLKLLADAEIIDHLLTIGLFARAGDMARDLLERDLVPPVNAAAALREAWVHSVVGHALLSIGDERGVALVQGWLERPAVLPADALMHSLYLFHRERGAYQAARDLLGECTRRQTAYAAMHDERRTFPDEPVYHQHDQPTKDLRPVADLLAASFPTISKAYLVQKKLTFETTEPCLLMMCAMDWWRPYTDAGVAEMEDKLNKIIGLGAGGRVIVVTAKQSALYRRIGKISNALFYIRRRHLASL